MSSKLDDIVFEVVSKTYGKADPVLGQNSHAGPGVGGGRNRGVPGYPVPPEMKAAPRNDESSEIHEGTFIGLKLPPGIPEKLAIEGGESPDKLHVTFFYKKGLSKEAERFVFDTFDSLFEKAQGPASISIKLGGVGRFSASDSSDGKDVLYVSVDSPQLQKLHDDFSSKLRAVGIEPTDGHGYVPHVTLAYVDPKEFPPFKRLVKPIHTGLVDPIKKSASRTGFVSSSVPNSIPHLEDLKDDEFVDFFRKLNSDDLDISEKVDGSCRIEFGIYEGKLWTKSKSGRRIFEASQHPRRPMQEAHRALASAAGRKLFPEGSSFVGDVLHCARPNTIKYEGPKRIVVHSGTSLIEKTCVPEFWEIWPKTNVGRLFEKSQKSRVGDLLKLVEKKKNAARSGHLSRQQFQELKSSVVESLNEMVRSKKSVYGGEIVEGYVLRDWKTGRVAKLVDKKLFTEMNKFFWLYREKIGRGVKEDVWKPGIMTSLRNDFCRRVVGHQTILSPSFSRILESFCVGRSVDEGLTRYIVEKHLFNTSYLFEARVALVGAKSRLSSLKQEWNSKRIEPLVFESRGLKFEMDEDVKSRTDEAFDEAEKKLSVVETELDSLTGLDESKQKLLLFKRALGESFLSKLSESPEADTIGVTIGRFQPFHKGHAKMVRDLATKFTKTIVLIAGNKKDEKNPFSFDLRKEMIQKSLPDVMNKIELYKAETDGKPNGYVPGILDQIIKDENSSINAKTAINLLVGEDQFEEFKKQMEHARKYKDSHEDFMFDPNSVVVEKIPGVKSDGDEVDRISGTAIRQALREGEKKKVEVLLDPHVVSDPASFDDLYQRMRKEMGSDHPKKEQIKESVSSKDLKSGQKIYKAVGLDIIYEFQNLLSKRKKIDIRKVKFLGAGSQGAAFDTGDGRVIKITSDVDEARSSMLLKQNGQNLKHIVQIFDVFRFPDTTSTFGIIQEKLQNISPQDKKEFDDIELRYILNVPDASFDSSKKFHEAVRDYFVHQIFKISSYDSADQETQSEIDREMNVFLEKIHKFDLDKMIDELSSVGISFVDYHSNNLMKRGNDFVVIDIGFSKQKNVIEPPVLETLAKKIFEDLASVGGEKTMEMILLKNRDLLLRKKSIVINKLKKLGSGQEGVAYDVGNGKVLKLTADEDEAKASMVLKHKGSNLKYVARIYDVFKFGVTPGTQHPVFGIYEEMLIPLTQEEKTSLDKFSIQYLPDNRSAFSSIDKLVSEIKDNIYEKHGLARPSGLSAPPADIEKTTKANKTPFASTVQMNTVQTKTNKIPAGLKNLKKSGSNLAVLKQEAETELKTVVDIIKKYKIDEMVKELSSVGIMFADYHGGNLMKRGSDYVINDIGRSRTVGDSGNMPVLENIEELVDSIVEDIATLSGMGTSICNVRGGSSGWSSPRGNNTKDDEEDPGLWQNSVAKSLAPMVGTSALPKKKKDVQS